MVDVDVQIAKALELQRKYDVRMFYADPSRPDNIARAAARGLRVIPAQNDIVGGIEEVRRWMRADGGFLIHPQNEAALEEIRAYRYPDTGRKGAEEVPIDRDNHYVDSLRYLIFSTRQFPAPQSPIPEPTPEEMAAMREREIRRRALLSDHELAREGSSWLAWQSR